MANIYTNKLKNVRRPGSPAADSLLLLQHFRVLCEKDGDFLTITSTLSINLFIIRLVQLVDSRNESYY